MKVILVKDYDAVSKEAFAVMKEVVTNKKDAVLGLATGSSPIGLYKNMIQDHKDNGTSYAQCQSFNLDEYVGIDRNHPESYWTFMHENLFKGIDLPEDKIHVPYGSTKEDCEGYEKAMENVSVDVQVLGIGGNGHIGFNEPGEAFEKETHCVDLTESTIKANARFFESMDEVPKQAYTMGIKSIMAAKKILLVATGSAKADALYKSLYGPITPNVPASILQLHQDVTVVADEDALSLIKEKGLL